MTKTYLILIFLFFIGCKKESECTKNFYISGKVTDQSLNPLSDVQVIGVTNFNYTYNVTSTNASGDYTAYEGKYSDLGDTRYIFRKSGYQDLTTRTFNNGDGTCNDQYLIIDGQLVP